MFKWQQHCVYNFSVQFSVQCFEKSKLNNMEYSLLFCTCPDEAIALSLAKQVVEAKLAACVNVVPHLHSVYRWKNSIETSKEVLMIIKTKSQTYKALENFLTEAHPYECPEIIACAITQGSPKYLQWIDEALANPV